jgi:hypothetical protein
MDINRGIRRLAKMTGATPPSDRSLQQRIAKRMLSLDVSSGNDKRFNRLDIHNVGDVQLEKRFNQVGVLNPRRMGTRQSIEAPEPPTAANSLGLAIEYAACQMSFYIWNLMHSSFLESLILVISELYRLAHLPGTSKF